MIATPTLRPIEGACAAEALDVDLARPLDAGTLVWIEHAFASHPVLIFREQDLGPGELATFGRCFGEPKLHSLVDYRHHQYPEVSWLTNVDKDGHVDWFGVKRATDWHTDSPYEDEPPRLAILHAKEVPSSKGGTMFADMRAAYDALSGEMRQRLAGMVGLHGRHDGPAGVRLYQGEPDQRIDRDYPEKARPAVVTHPVSGRTILFVNPLHTHGLQGMPRDEAWALTRGPRRADPPSGDDRVTAVSRNIPTCPRRPRTTCGKVLKSVGFRQRTVSRREHLVGGAR